MARVVSRLNGGAVQEGEGLWGLTVAPERANLVLSSDIPHGE